jgi:hypothetical protein
MSAVFCLLVAHRSRPDDLVIEVGAPSNTPRSRPTRAKAAASGRPRPISVRCAIWRHCCGPTARRPYRWFVLVVALLLDPAAVLLLRPQRRHGGRYVRGARQHML